MPGYIHTCENCGAHMQVHERYLGRNLRCTSCRNEFLAEIPEDVDVVEPPPEILDEDLPPKKQRRWKRWLLLLIPIAALIWWLGQDQSGGAADSVFRAERGSGLIGTLSRGSDAPIYVALEQEQASRLRKFDEADRIEANYQDMVAEGLCFQVAPGTGVRVLVSPGRGAEVRVRILDGPWESRVGWVPGRWVQ